MGILAIIELIISILGELPTIIKIVTEIWALLFHKTFAEKMAVHAEVLDILNGAKEQKLQGIEPDSNDVEAKLTAIRDRLKQD